MPDLANSRVIVTGGSAGLGLAMVEALAERGADVTAIARNDTKFGAARDAGARTIAGDATDAELINRIVADIDPDVLILNAGARAPIAEIDQQDWAGFSAVWNTDVKATLIGVQAALRTPMRPGARAPIMSSGAAMVMSHPAIDPSNLSMSGGYIGAKRMIWFMAHQANAVSRGRKLAISFQVLVPSQLIAGTELGRSVAATCAQVEGLGVDEYVLKRYDSHLLPSQIGRQVAELLAEPRYETGVAYGFRDSVDIMPLDQ
ncbi:MAG: SDR family oxidoreductase [Sphingosinicella sp.]|nr:SDR family oxidoreductase [Sphingosinicella sp.]